jgi:hypothetical protein
MLTIHLFNHEGSPEEQEQSRIAHPHEHMRWDSGSPISWSDALRELALSSFKVTAASH